MHHKPSIWQCEELKRQIETMDKASANWQGVPRGQYDRFSPWYHQSNKPQVLNPNFNMCNLY